MSRTENPTRPPSDEEVLRLLAATPAGLAGAAPWRELARGAAEATSAAGAWIAERREGTARLRRLAFWLREGGFVEPVEYLASGSPCERVIERGLDARIDDGVTEAYPGASELRLLRAASYWGAPLINDDGSILGLLAVFDTRPMPNDARMTRAFQAFVRRAAQELERRRMMETLRFEQAQMAAVMDFVEDAILMMDSELRVTRCNAAGGRLFRRAVPDLVGRDFRELLQPGSASRLSTLVRGVGRRELERGARQRWTTQDLMARRMDGTPFAAEATLLHLDFRGAPVFTLVLRSLEDRVEARRQLRLLAREAEQLRLALAELGSETELLGRSPGMQAVLAAIERAAPTNATVLVAGEPGTGKGAVAHAIHRASRRSDKPMIRVNCGSPSTAGLEVDLFGQAAGALSGTSPREGRLALADGGTLFLDEVSELPMEAQGRLLKALQEGEYEPVGGGRAKRVDARIIASTSADLQRLVATGAFRADLHFRLEMFPITLPPLRDRGEDIDLLAQAFAIQSARRMARRVEPLSQESLQLLREYSWPGNVRELQNVIERAIMLSGGPRIDIARALGPTSGQAGG